MTRHFPVLLALLCILIPGRSASDPQLLELETPPDGIADLAGNDSLLAIASRDLPQVRLIRFDDLSGAETTVVDSPQLILPSGAPGATPSLLDLDRDGLDDSLAVTSCDGGACEILLFDLVAPTAPPARADLQGLEIGAAVALDDGRIAAPVLASEGASIVLGTPGAAGAAFPLDEPIPVPGAGPPVLASLGDALIVGPSDWRASDLRILGPLDASTAWSDAPDLLPPSDDAVGFLLRTTRDSVAVATPAGLRTWDWLDLALDPSAPPRSDVALPAGMPVGASPDADRWLVADAGRLDSIDANAPGRPPRHPGLPHAPRAGRSRAGRAGRERPGSRW